VTAPVDRVLNALVETGSAPRQSGDGWAARCPAHDDNSPSLSVSVGAENRAVLHCHAGCDIADVIKALGLQLTDLFEANGNGTTKTKIIATYPYTDENGAVLYETVRLSPKDFRQRRRVDNEWVWNLKETRRVLYHLPRLIAAVDRGETVWIAEGEKDCDALIAAGAAVATCNPLGAGKWSAVKDAATYFKGAKVVIVADKDDVGRNHAADVAQALRGVAGRVDVVEAADGKDAAEHFAAGRTLEDFVVVELDREDERSPEPIDLDGFLAEPEPDHDWVIPNVVERTERIIVTAPEGAGKSTFLRQMGVQAACGIHPFTLEDMPAVTVAHIDLENPRRHLKRKLGELRTIAGARLEKKRYFPIARPEGIDLLDDAQAGWLMMIVDQIRPDIITIGPIYKMASGDPTAEEPARKASHQLDLLRVNFNCALIIEAHSPYAPAGKRRPERPYGASLWSRWPEFGIFIAPSGAIRHWRGPRDERAWPSLLQRDGEWPWTVPVDKTGTYAKIVESVETAGRRLSIREIAAVVGIPKSNVDRAIKANAKHWTMVMGEFPDDEQDDE
jgi:hypothetical protein